MRNRHLLILCLLLVAVGGSLFLYKWLDLGVPIRAENAIGAWTVEARVRFTAQSGKPVKVRLAVPLRPPGFALLDETFVSSGYGLSTEVKDGDREALWAIRRARGEQELYYQAVVYPEAREPATSNSPPVAATAVRRRRGGGGGHPRRAGAGALGRHRHLCRRDAGAPARP